MQSNKVNTELASVYNDIYSWCTLALSYPRDNQFIDDVLETLEGLQGAVISTLDIREELNTLKEFKKNKDNMLLILQQEYSRLFIGPFSLLAPPYESYYLNRGVVLGENSSLVEHYYSQAGIKITVDFKDAPDHIILETEFLAKLCEMEENAWSISKEHIAASYRKLQSAFLEQHLLLWFNQFQKAVEQGVTLNFYPTAIKILEKGLVNHYRALVNSDHSPS